MWRSTVFTENENSDQSISEDDDLNEGVHVSLGISADIKGEVQILSQLDMLRDANEVNHERDQTSLSQKSQADTCDEDDVEFPIFANNGDFTYACNSDEDVISDNEITGNCMQLSKRFAYEADNYQKNVHSSIGGNGKDGICTWLAANTESDAFINVKDDADSVSLLSASAKVKRSSKGGLGKTKHKFSIRTHVNNNLYTDTSLVDEIHTSVKEKDMDESKKYGMITELPVLHTHTTTSIAELLDRVQDEHDISKEHTMKYNITEDISEQPSVGRSLLSVDQRYVEDDVECLGSDTSDEDEDNHQVQEHTLAGYKQKTIADQFQEALGAASTNEEGHTYAVPRLRGIGLFGQLQRVMQIEKERDLYSLNNLQRENEDMCFDVKILSKSLEARLTVCSCSSIDNFECCILLRSSTRKANPQNVANRKNMTIIFSSRVCTDIDLDVGTLVRIHPPWKEVNVKGTEEITILSTYFSQI